MNEKMKVTLNKISFDSINTGNVTTSNTKEKKKVEIIEFTDPVCTWCWGSEPILRKLETNFGSQIEVKYIMGGLVKDIREYYDDFHGIGKDPVESNKQIAKHWLEASNQHKMPVDITEFHLFTNEDPSSYPQNIAYKALQMESVKKADRFLRRLREATATEGRQTNRKEVLIELVSEVGGDLPLFIKRYTDGTAQKAFEEDLKIAEKYRVQVFPSYLIRYGEKEVLIRSYQSYEAFCAVIDTMFDGEIKENKVEATESEILKFIQKYERVTLSELEFTFELSGEAMREILKSLEERRLCAVFPVGNGFFVESTSEVPQCDEELGICKM